jgi:hypothetical protein
MDFRSLLHSLTSLSEGETKETGKGRVHKGTYGTEYDTDKEGNEKKKEKPKAEKKGRGRPKKEENDDTKKFDSSALNSVFGGKKPKKEVGKVSKKHSLKEYMESVEDTKNAEAVMEGMFGGVDHTNVAANLGKLAKVIKSVQTPEQFKVAQKYAQRMSGTIMKHQHDNSGFGSGLRANIAVSRAIQDDLKRKAAELGIDYQSLEETGGDQIEIKPASQTQTQVIQQGNKTLGTVDNPQLAQQIKQSIGKGEMSFASDEQGMSEGKDEGKPGKNFAKIAKSAGQKYGSKAAGERVAGAVRNKLKAQGKLEEAKPDFLDVDKDGNKKETFKKAVKDKKKVAESIQLNEGSMKELMLRLFDDLNVGAQGYNIKPAVELQDRALATRVIDKTLAHDDRYRRLSHTLKSQLRDAALEEFGFTDFDSSLEEANDAPGPVDSIRQHTQHGLDAKPSRFVAVDPNPPKTPWKVDPIERTTQEIGAGARRAFDFIRGTKESTFEGKNMKDIQVESWEKQLNGLLTEGITVSSSQGQQGAPDSVSVTATENDAQSLMSVLRNAGIGGFGAEPASPEIGYGVAQGGEDEPTGTGTEPQPSPDVVGDDGDMLDMIKKMAGLGGGDAEVVAIGGEEGGQDYEDEEGSDDQGGEEQSQTLEPADSDEEGSDEESDDEESEDDETETTDEGNAFGQEVRQKKSDNIPDSQQKIKTGGQNLPVKEGEHECNECGMMESSCECDSEQVNEFANDAGGNAMGDTELMKLKALLSMGGDMHKLKRDQTVGNPTQVSMAESLAQWKKLSGIKK